MSGQIVEAKINEVRDRTDIIELVSRYVTLKRTGANHTGLCPFHSEKSPSFSVHAGRQFYHCFGCGVGGDVFSFLMQIEGLAFPEAVKRLAGQAGIEIEERELSPEQERRQQQRDRLYRVNELAAGYFHQVLMGDHPAGEPGRQYLKSRGYGRKAAGEYQLGFSVDAWEGLSKYFQQQGVNAEDARTLGLIRPGKEGRGDYDLFRGRLMFPIFDLSGQVVAFGGRILDDSKPKYINSPESPIYHKGQVLYGLYQARQAMRQAGEVILVEGYFDQLALYRAGFQQVVATCGTALTSEHARLLKRYVQRVLLLFDQDSAGKAATFKAMAALQDEGLPAAVIELPGGDDPDSFVQRQGAADFRLRLGQARPVMDLFMEDALAGAGSAVEERVLAVETVIERIAELTGAMQQDLYLKDLAERSGIDLQLLKQQLAEACRKSTPRREENHPVASSFPPFSEPAAGFEYPEPPPHGDEYQPLVGSTAAVDVPCGPEWGKGEERLLATVLLLPEERTRLAEVIDGLFVSVTADAFAREILASEKALDDETLLDDFSGDYRPFVSRFLQIPIAEVEGTFDSLLVAVRREALQKQYDVVRQKLQLANRSGNEELQTELNIELTRLKLLK